MSNLKPLKDILPKASLGKYKRWYNKFVCYRNKVDPEKKENIDLLVESYVQNMMDKGLAPGTIKSELTAVYKFITFNENHYVNKITADRIKGALKNYENNAEPPKQSAVLSDENCRDFLNCPYEDLKTLQLKVALIVAIFSGLRHGELYALNKNNLQIFDNYASVRIEKSKTDQNGKGFDGIIPLEDGNVKLRRILCVYYEQLNSCDEGPLFPSVRHNAFMNTRSGERQVGSWPKQIAKFLNLPNFEDFTGHCFRRTMATLAAEHGASIEDLMVQGRWKGGKTAGIYIDNSTDKKLTIAKKTLTLSPKKKSCCDEEEICVKRPKNTNDSLNSILGGWVFNNCEVHIKINDSKELTVQKHTQISQTYSQ